MEIKGALWKKSNDNPKAPFASGNIKIDGKEIRITIWNNRKRPDRKDPDFTIAEDKPRANDSLHDYPPF